MAVPTWRDPLHGLRHDFYEVVDGYGFQRLIGYETACGLKLTVDDINKKTLQHYEPTCLACIVRGMIPGKE